jgi:hypothetical protein
MRKEWEIGGSMGFHVCSLSVGFPWVSTFSFHVFLLHVSRGCPRFPSNYPYAIGPRLGAAYQIKPRTVFRAGIGIVYSKTASNGMVSISGVSANNNFVSPGLNQPAMWLNDGIPVEPVWPNFA